MVEQNFMYFFLVWLTGAIAVGLPILAYYRFRDSFHPAIFLGFPLAYPYFLAPLLLNDEGSIVNYLPMESMDSVQLIYLLGITALLLGTLVVRQPSTRFYEAELWSQVLARPLRKIALFLGTLGIIGYLISVYSSGGFIEVYSVSHRGEGLELSGYIRNLTSLVIPAILLLYLSSSAKKIESIDVALIACFAAPIIFRAIIIGSRGDTFAIIVTLVVGWYITRGKRPSLLVVIGGGIALALLLLSLVVHRDVLHLGTEFEFKGIDEAIEFMSRSSTGTARGHEYIYGSGTIINSMRTENYEWGGRYVEKILIRAIPGFIWPSQYEDIRDLFKLPQNRLSAQVETLNWSATGGSSTGLIADLWLQFWWYYLPILYLVGWRLGIAWRKCVSQGGIWFIGYVIMLTVSLHLTQQTLQAWLWQVLFLSGITWVIWRWMLFPKLEKIKKYMNTNRNYNFSDFQY